MFNEVVLLGRVGSVEKLENVLKFSMATNESWKDKESGEWVNKSTWHNCVVFGKFGQSLSKRLTKGAQIFVKGKLQYNTTEDKDGNKKYFTSIVTQEAQLVGGKPAKNDAEETESTDEAPKAAPKSTKNAPKAAKKDFQKEIN